MLRPDTITKTELQQVSEHLTEWFDPGTVGKMLDAAASVSPPTVTPAIQTESVPEASANEPAENEPDGIALPPSFMLEESFEIYTLGAESIAASIHSERDFKELVKRADRRHYQIKVNNQPVAFARCIRSDREPGHHVSQLFISDLARAIDSAIGWLDDFDEEHPEFSRDNILVRLLVVPAYNVHAFWLLKEDGTSDVLVIEAEPELTKLKPEHIFSSHDFLNAFEGQSPITGLNI